MLKTAPVKWTNLLVADFQHVAGGGIVGPNRADNRVHFPRLLTRSLASVSMGTPGCIWLRKCPRVGKLTVSPESILRVGGPVESKALYAPEQK